MSNKETTLSKIPESNTTRSHLKLRVCERRFNTNRESIWVIMGLASGDNSASSKLTVFSTTSGSYFKSKNTIATHSIGVSSPSTFPRNCVNLHIKPYTNRDSHLSLGCVAFDGGHTCPFFSVVSGGAAFMMRSEVVA